VIDLLVADDRRGFGIATALAIEGIPVRRITRAAEFNGRVLVASAEQLDGATAALARQVPTVVIGEGDGHGDPCPPVSDEPLALPFDEAIWPASVRRLARVHGDDALLLPRATGYLAPAGLDGAVLATFHDARGRRAPAVVQRGRQVWCLLDLGSALTDLLSESYLPAPPARSLRPGATRSALALYYRAPDAVRRVVQRRSYARLDRHLRSLGARASRYPVDPSGWLLIELLKALIRRAGGELVRLARWPAPYTSAATLTHDIEPCIYAYTAGLERLLARVARSGHPATFGLIAGPASRSLFVRSEAELRRAEVLCHGLEHRGETLEGPRMEIAAGIERARALLERRLERPITGFRSPRLDRSADLVWALDRLGFEYDSSYPDVDRESLDHFGGGVRLNVPYRPPVTTGGGRLRASRCLELPVSAPDCIQPLFQGDDIRQLRRAVRAKIAFVQDTGGLYVGIVHGGVFGARDAARRGAHLGFVRRQLDRADVWLATAGDVARWWAARERLALQVVADRVVVTNEGRWPVGGARILVERESGGTATLPVPLLDPGQSITLGLLDRDLPGAKFGVQEAS
jgi:peptidoglycan/xylan/chitin deacetylase (PgdA/CDA1 family)